MKIGVDLHVFDDGPQGSRRYLEGLYTALSQINSGHEFIGFLGNLENRPAGWGDGLDWREYATLSRIKRLTLSAYLATKKTQLDFMHYQYVTPLFRNSPEVLTVHDILFESHPKYFPRVEGKLLSLLIKRSISRATHVFTVSEFSKSELIYRYNVPEDKISITTNAVDKFIFNAGDNFYSKAWVASRFNVSDYILTVGRLEPRKNHIGLLIAYARLKELHADLPRIVILGPPDFGFDAIMKFINSNNLSDNVVFVHGVDDAGLAHFYRAAILMVYPSFAEGFGIPPLEAMACGCPIICSGTTGLKEVVAGVGWVIEPEVIDTIQEAILAAIQSPALCDESRLRGIERADMYSWASSAEKFLVAIEQN